MVDFKYQKLRGRIIEKFGSQQKFAEELDIGENTLSRKLTGAVRFNQEEITQWCEILDIKMKDIPEYFFT